MVVKKKDDIRIIRPASLPDIEVLTGNIQKVIYRPHTHDEYAIGVVESGVQRFQDKSGFYDAPTGTIFTLNPGDVHAGESATETGYRYKIAYLPQSVVRQSLASENETIAGYPYLKQRLTKDPGLAQTLSRLLTSMTESSTCRVKAESELVLFLRRLFHRHGEFVDQTIQDAGGAVVQTVKDMIQKRFSEPVTLTEMAELAGLSRYHFIRVFQNKTGLSPHSYLTQVRVCNARIMIESGLTLAEAAFSSGFSDQSHMARYFKSIYGVTPGTFRKLS